MKKEKKIFGYFELEKHINKWITVAVICIFTMVIFTNAGKIMESYDKKDCGGLGCAKNFKEQEDIIQMQIGKKVRSTEEEFETNGLTYRLYAIGENEEFMFAGWKKYENGLGLKDTVQGVEEKELIKLSEDNQYVFVWSNKEEKIVIRNNGNEVEQREKGKNEIKIEKIKMESKDKITFD